MLVWRYELVGSTEMFNRAFSISTVCRHSPLLVSQILTVLLYDAHATWVESCEKAIDLTPSLWPSSVCRQAFQLSPTAGIIVIHFGSSSLNVLRIKLRVGLNTIADVYT